MATRANLIATYQNNPTLQSQYTQQQYLDLFDFGVQTPTPDPDPTPTPPSDGIQNIIGQNLNQGGGGGGGIQSLQQTFTPGAQPKSNYPKGGIGVDELNQKIYNQMGTQMGPFSNDPLRNQFETLTQEEFMTQNPEYFSQGNLPRTGLLGIKDKVTDFFSNLSTPRVRGTLGTRLSNQPRLPLPASIAAYSVSPFNPDSKKFNPAFEGQLNYLEGLDGFIGRDQQSGGLKYGPESVLSGQNVISAFGSNDYVKQLDKYIEKMEKRGTVDDEFSITNLTDFQLAKYNKAKIEKQKFIDSTIYKAQQEEIKKQQEAAAAKARQAAYSQARRDRDAAVASGLDAAIKEGRDTSGFDRPSSGAYAEAAGMTVGGGYNTDYGFKDGGRVYLYNRLK